MDNIYNEYFDKIYNWAILKTHNKEDAEDLTNNIFLALFEYFNKNISIDKIDNLIWKIAHNIWCKRAKLYIKEKNNINLEENFGYIEPSLDKIIYKEIISNIENIGLSKNELVAFRLYYLNDLSIKEISAKLNTKDTNVKYYLYQARKKIKERYYE